MYNAKPSNHPRFRPMSNAPPSLCDGGAFLLGLRLLDEFEDLEDELDELANEEDEDEDDWDDEDD